LALKRAYLSSQFLLGVATSNEEKDTNFIHPFNITPTQPSPIKGEGFRSEHPHQGGGEMSHTPRGHAALDTGFRRYDDSI
jgi:hypothetical protein